MNHRLERLRDVLVALDVADGHHRPMGADEYLAAAQTARQLVREELGCLSIGDFSSTLGALQTLAENIYFDAYGQLADADGSGDAYRALEIYGCLAARCAVATCSALSKASMP
jgi:hypothetical protein